MRGRGGFAESSVKFRHQAISFVSASPGQPVQPQPDAFVRVAATFEDDGDEEDEDVEMDAGAGDDVDDGVHMHTQQTNIAAIDTDLDLSEGAIANMNIQSSAEMTGPEDNTDGTSDVEIIVDEKIAAALEVADAPMFFVDTAGDAELSSKFGVKKAGKRPEHRSPSLARSDSSEENVVFRGRNQPAKVVNDPVAHPLRQKPAPQQRSQAQQFPLHSTRDQDLPSFQQQPPTQRPPHVTDDLLAALYAIPHPVAPENRSPGWIAEPQVAAADVWTPAPTDPHWKGNLAPCASSSNRIDNNATTVPKESVTDLKAGWKATLKHKKSSKEPDLSRESLKETTKPVNRKGKRGRKKDNKQMRGPIMSDDDDSDGEAAYDDYMANLIAQMTEEDSSADVQTIPVVKVEGAALMVDGRSIADDEVLPASLRATDEDDDDEDDEDEDDSSNSDNDPIGRDRTYLTDTDSEQLNYSDLEESELEDELEKSERHQWEDEEDLRQRRIERMSDEQYARLLAKQQELGYHGDQLVLDDGSFVPPSSDSSDDSDVEYGDVIRARRGLQELANGGKTRSKQRREDRAAKDAALFPDAFALADAVEQYGDKGFDIMDRERPSLRTPKKGRKAQLAPDLDDLSDEELRDAMLDA